MTEVGSHGGWYWEEYDPVNDKWKNYHTNGHGEGLFTVKRDGTSKQLFGTSQFSLPSKKKNAYAKIYRMHKREYFYDYD